MERIQKGKDKFPELNNKSSWKSENILRIPEYKRREERIWIIVV